jgi:hypothetical protein
MPAWEHLEKVGLPGNSNAQLAYSSADGSFSLWTRVRKLSHRWEAIYTESHAREYRAMYPHQRAVGQFALTFECNGYSVKPESVYDFNPNDNTAANGLGKVVTGAAQNTKDTVESILDALGRANG